jgi:hypothetical protein
MQKCRGTGKRTTPRSNRGEPTGDACVNLPTEGMLGGQVYIPVSVVRVLVELGLGSGWPMVVEGYCSISSHLSP